MNDWYLISTSIGIASRRHYAAAATPSRHGVDSPFRLISSLAAVAKLQSSSGIF